MKKRNVWLLLMACMFVVFSCGESNKEAKEYLLQIRGLYDSGEYDEAKSKIDSIQVLYPKAFEQIKEGMALLQDVRIAQDTKQIAYCDSLIKVLQTKIDSVKHNFVFEKNKDYEETGRFIPKVLPGTSLSSTMLRSGVAEDGGLYIESVYIGGQYHNMVRVQTKDGEYAETLAVEDDGLNFRFNNLGKQYEVIKFSKSDENGLSKFIYACADKPLTVVLKGKNTFTYPLSVNSKKSISESYQLSVFMQQADSLSNVKEVSQARIEYLNRKQQGTETNMEQ